MPDMSSRAILVFRSCGLGDFILSAPAFQELRRQFPERKVVLLTMQSSIPSVAASISSYAQGSDKAPWVDLLMPHLIDEVISIADPRSFADLMRAWTYLGKHRFDLVVQMFDVGTPFIRRVKKMALIAALLGPVRQIGWRARGFIEAGKVPLQDPHLDHHVYGPLQFLKELNGAAVPVEEDLKFDLRETPDDTSWAESWLSANAEPGTPLVSIAPGSAQPHKSWPTERFVALCEALLKTSDRLKIVVTGTASDSLKAQAMQRLDQARVHDLCGQTSIGQSAALYRYCNLVVGNDGGAMHLADAVGSRVVSIVPGLEFPNSIEPWHNRHRAIRHPVPCAPCYSFTFCPEGHNRCMLELPLEPVLNQCLTVLREESIKARR